MNKHDFIKINIILTGTCSKCTKNIVVSHTVDKEDMKMFNAQPYQALDTEAQYQKLTKHECTVSD